MLKALWRTLLWAVSVPAPPERSLRQQRVAPSRPALAPQIASDAAREYALYRLWVELHSPPAQSHPPRVAAASHSV